MVFLERIVFSFLVISPLIGLGALFAKWLSNTHNSKGNDALYYSICSLVAIVGIFFDVLSLPSSVYGDYAKSFLASWNFLTELNGFLYFGFFVGCVWGLSSINTSREVEAISEVFKFIAKVAGATAGAFFLLALFNVIAPIASQIN